MSEKTWYVNYMLQTLQLGNSIGGGNRQDDRQHWTNPSSRKSPSDPRYTLATASCSTVQGSGR